MKNEQLLIVKLTENAYTPTRGSLLAAGYDLYSAYDYIIPAEGKALVKTDIKIYVPYGTYGRLAPCSGLAWLKQIHIGGGVIDRDYRGNVCVIMINLGKEDVEIKKKSKIAQLICEKITYPSIKIVDSLNETDRGANGFGSTG